MRRRPVLALAASLVALGLGVALAAAQEPAPSRPVGAYAGVTPGTNNLPPRAPAAGGGARLLTWPGFQARPDGASRFFVQTTVPVSSRLLREPGRVVVVLEGTRIHLTNNRRPLETRYFNTPVDRAWVERRGNDLALVLSLRADVAPAVSTGPSENGYHYLFVEFPPGDFVPEELRTVEMTEGGVTDDRPETLR